MNNNSNNNMNNNNKSFDLQVANFLRRLRFKASLFREKPENRSSQELSID